jgi:hypothetical protein
VTLMITVTFPTYKPKSDRDHDAMSGGRGRLGG